MYACVHVPQPEPSEATTATLRAIAGAFSPQAEWVATHTVVFPVTGLQHFYPSVAAIAEALTTKLREQSLVGQIGLAANPLAAVQAAVSLPGTTVIPPGEEAARLAEIPLDAVAPLASVRDILQRWGIETLGELAALPESGLVARLGDEARRLRRAALGLAARPLVPETPPQVFQDTLDLEYPLDTLEPLLFLLARSLEQVCSALVQQSLATDEIRLSLRLESRAEYVRQIRVPMPSADRMTWLKLIQLDMSAHPPESAVLAYTLLAQPTAPRTWQRDLFSPPAPEPESWEVTLARLHSLLGPEYVGSPVLVNSHRPDAWTLERFQPPTRKPTALPPRSQSWAVRYFRPPRPAHVSLNRRARPIRVAADEIAGIVVAAAGPWPTSGSWWTEAQWDREDWDLELADQVVYRVFHDLVFQSWHIEGYYD